MMSATTEERQALQERCEANGLTIMSDGKYGKEKEETSRNEI